MVGSRVARRTIDALVGALALVAIESFTVVVFARASFAGTWEMSAVSQRIVPLAWLSIAPVAVAGAALWRTAEVTIADQPGVTRSIAWVARLLLAIAGAAAFSMVAWGVSGGRHFAEVSIRSGFVAAVALLGGVAFSLGLPAFMRFFGEKPRMTIAVVAASAVLLETANRLILPRLYPAFHGALTAATVLLAPLIGDAFLTRVSTRLRHVLAVATLAGLVFVGLRARVIAAKLVLADNLRWIFLDRAPLAEEGLALAARLTQAPLDRADDFSTGTMPPALRAGAASAHRLDWRGRDVVLITIDALRADHVGAYGYSRPTTPHIDALARAGMVFTHAYCATPHTSYSVTSIMTGKNMRPLLAQGLGADSETWADLLRRYDYRSAAFYPPAVFFIDPDKFETFRDTKLGFEYARVKFSDPIERAREVVKYLDNAPPEHPAFLWVHLFEPHEPYVAHSEHPFGDRDIDRYDSEIAAADDGVGRIVDAVRQRRSHAIVIVTADHGEEFGEHGGRYHGTTVFEEQVRVPLIVVGEGISAGKVDEPVQAIDLLPTVLSALDIPRPARLGGRDIGGLFAQGSKNVLTDEGLAFAETDEQTLFARGSFRLICNRRAAACALYDVANDPGETRNVSDAHASRFGELKREIRMLEASQGDLERPKGEGKSGPPGGWPGALRRGMSGDADAALEIATLLDDADPAIRARAAEISFRLKSPDAIPALGLARDRTDDVTVRRWCALALLRLGQKGETSVAAELLADPDIAWRRAAALALAENGDARGSSVLVEQWQHRGEMPTIEARELLAAFSRIRAVGAVGALLRSLDDVRLRADIARTLAAIGDVSARAPLLERFTSERYETARIALAAALVDLGAKAELAPSLGRFLGVADPLPGGLGLAVRAGILRLVGGEIPARDVAVAVTVPAGGNGTGLRVLLRGSTTNGKEADVSIATSRGTVHLRLPATTAGAATEIYGALGAAGTTGDAGSPQAGAARMLLRLEVPPNAHVEAVAVVPLADGIPPPPPEPWKEEPSEVGPR